ncbi:MAG: phospholipase D family protein [Alphaproteobacteria bacterium]|nr:phospholipase D family protein [Alphaproteobacteria bacterium]MDX5370161.1 phospholipase D family protein [Alphaproteobacteria bacterium]MDX5464718.1 phospholipase D family protein [Alphaproteobacteria bacterium]
MLARVFAGIALCFVLTACGSVPRDYPKTASLAVPPSGATTLETMFAPVGETRQGDSGFALLTGGREAFTARIELADRAERTLDVQYYIWDSDATGVLLAERLLRAADRGVRVRVLIDDLNIDGRDYDLAAIDAHPNVEMRLFNPFASRDAQLINFFLDMHRLNHRMHNKLFVADNAVAILGGRNIADIYFQVASDANYRDLDVLTVGPVVQQASNVFDYFWNSEWAIPAGAVLDTSNAAENLAKLRAVMRDYIAQGKYPHPLSSDEKAFEAALPALRESMIRGHARVVWDDPGEFGEDATRGAIMRNLDDVLAGLERELLVESAYFVVPREYVERVGDLIAKGVRVRVLTNSLETNDVIAAHAGHAAHRPALIRKGVEMYELKAEAETVEKRIFPMRSRAALHTKALAFDREAVFIGSFNLDPRSATLNTEIGLYIESPELAGRLIAYLDEGVQPDSSYRVTLDDDGNPIWTTTDTDGRAITLTREPGTSFGRRFMVDLINMLPVERML